MADEGATKDPGEQQPDFKKGWEAASEAGVKPADQSETATSTTMPEAASETAGQAEAAQILKEAGEKDTGSPA